VGVEALEVVEEDEGEVFDGGFDEEDEDEVVDEEDEDEDEDEEASVLGSVVWPEERLCQ